MITLYHGKKPYIPLLAAYTHLAVKDAACKIDNGLDLNWRQQPLFFAGKDKYDGSVGCLVHGSHQALYCRAVNGIAAVFGFEVRCLDADKLFTSILPKSLNSKFLLLLASHIPVLMRPADKRRLREVFENYLKIQEEQR
jgi:hypothetical protein